MALMQWLLPQHCLLCGVPSGRDEPLCTPCKTDLPRLQLACEQCALPLPELGLCGACQRHPPAFQRCVCPLLYREPVTTLITALKFRRRLETAALLAGLIAARVQRNGDTLPELLIPVPLHPQRLRERGYNQALLLARPLSHRLNLPLENTACRRIRHQPTQLGLSRAQRKRNLRSAFTVTGLAAVKHVAIVDDVLTTGSTANALASALTAAGVPRVDLWIAARVEPRGASLRP